MEDTESGFILDTSVGQPRTCRICLEECEESDLDLIEPCNCKGSLRWVHRNCLSHWLRCAPLTANNLMGRCSVIIEALGFTFSCTGLRIHCELCGTPYRLRKIRSKAVLRATFLLFILWIAVICLGYLMKAILWILGFIPLKSSLFSIDYLHIYFGLYLLFLMYWLYQWTVVYLLPLRSHIPIYTECPWNDQYTVSLT
eukprot:jgi/Galph1/192/GphlegSOOS_G4929.1